MNVGEKGADGLLKDNKIFPGFHISQLNLHTTQ